MRSGNTVLEADNIQGEMPWLNERNMYLYFRDECGSWRCVECVHTPEEHYDPGPDDVYACFECSKCNCGNNSRM